MNKLQQLLGIPNEHIHFKEKFFSSLFASISLLIIGTTSWLYAGSENIPFITASVGAATVLVFAVPKSNLSQPWPLIGSQIVSAFIGVSCALYFNNPIIAAALAMGLAMFVMHLLRCLHPPGGATALGTALGGSYITHFGYSFVFFPVLFNAVILLINAILLNRLLSKNRYPAVKQEQASLSTQAAQWAFGPPRFSEDDLSAALEQMDTYIDISDSDLARIYALAVMNANKRRLGQISCRDIMTPSPRAIKQKTPLQDAWNQLNAYNVKAMPVIDDDNKAIGIVTVMDFMRYFNDIDFEEMLDKLRNNQQTLVVDDVMSSPLLDMRDDQHIVDLIPVFTEKKIHHLPITDKHGKLTGMITRSDLMRAMLVTRS